MSRYYKIFAVIFFPFFRALYVAFSMMFLFMIIFYFVAMPFIRPDSDAGVYEKIFSIGFTNIGIFVLSVISVWLLFYAGIAAIFKEERFDRFYEFSRSLKLTASIGAIMLALSLCKLIGFDLGKFIHGLFLGVSLFVFIPVILLETTRLGALMVTRKGYSRFKSQCFSFAIFLLLPLVVPFLAHWLFVTIFVLRH